MQRIQMAGIFLFCSSLVLTSAAHAAEPITKQVTPPLIGDGVTKNTAMIQHAIDDLSASGGGIVRFPPGQYLTGTIQLKDNVSLYLSDGATLLGSTNPADYRNLDPFLAGDGKATFGYALVTAIDAKHVGLRGPGSIDGQGLKLKAAQPKDFPVRPFLIRWERCSDVTVVDVHLTSPAAWTMHFFQCSNVLVQRLHIEIPKEHLINNDGIDLDSSHDVRVEDCDIKSGDDAICLKTTSSQPTHDIAINRCKLSTRTNGIKLGTESLGDFYNIKADHCQMHDINMAGIALYSVDGAHLHDASFSDITMDNVTVPISIRLGNRQKTFRPGATTRPAGEVRDVQIQNITATNAQQIGLLINGIPNHPIQNLLLKNIDITLQGNGQPQGANKPLPEKETAYPEWSMFGKTLPAFGVYIRHAQNITCQEIAFRLTNPDPRPMAILLDVTGTSPADFSVTNSQAPSQIKRQ